MTQNNISVKTTRSDIIKELWHRGELSFILYPHQRPIYKKMREVIDSEEIDANSYVLDISRQFGKSFNMFLIAVEECLRKEFTTVVYIAPLKKQVVEIVTENTFRTLFNTAPRSLIPTLKDSELTFANGSRIRLSGTDNHNYESLRGGLAHLILLDEAGFMSNLLTGVLPTVQPMTKTTGGKILFASTPPESLDHDYYDVLRDHDENGNISTFTIHDDKSLTTKQYNTIVSACKGETTTLFKREFECQRIAEQSKQVVPEFNMAQAATLIYPNNDYRNHEHYKHWSKYVVVDWGGRDNTAVLFAHYNYRTSKIVIDDYLNLVGMEISSARIARSIKDKTEALWPESTPTTRIQYWCDSNNILMQNDMITIHGLPFVSTTKGKLISQMVQKVRDWVYEDRVEFGPDAEFAFKSAVSAHWNNTKSTFAQSKTYGHYDHMAALIYLIRNVDESYNPIPKDLKYDPYLMHIDPIALNTKNALTSIFKNVN